MSKTIYISIFFPLLIMCGRVETLIILVAQKALIYIVCVGNPLQWCPALFYTIYTPPASSTLHVSPSSHYLPHFFQLSLSFALKAKHYLTLLFVIFAFPSSVLPLFQKCLPLYARDCSHVSSRALWIPVFPGSKFLHNPNPKNPIAVK